ncbi:malate dehydrogenase [Candidatus Woesearchaeota archaeon ex4484_78]|nr:MAG: malate dehydrogenase [Candidatus Woesearchaeota archaeon ex4484_78]
MPKISIIGAGAVGAQVAFLLVKQGLADVVLVDVVEGLAKGKALDVFHSLPVLESNVSVSGSCDYSLIKGSDIVVVTAGSPRKPGMSRDDLVQTNSRIIKAVIPEVVKFSPDCVLIVVTNPLNVMTQLAYRLSGFPKNKVIGMAGVLDSSRFRAFVSRELNVDPVSVDAFVLGDHGDLMVPLISQCRVNNKPLTELLPLEKIDEIVQKTRDSGAEIIRLSKQSTVFAPAVSIVEMIDCIVNDCKRVLSCSVLLQGEYGFNDLFVSVPVRLGKTGVEEVIELSLSANEKISLEKAVSHIRKMLDNL